MTQVSGTPPTIALALSGGGIRAAAFHAGVLRFLAEQCQLEAVSHISTVSGGSLLTGLVFSRSGLTWPSSRQFLSDTWPAIRSVLTGTNLQLRASGRLLLNPLNWRYVLSRANVLAQAISLDWGVSGSLGDLPPFPTWSINGTTAETGRRFRIKAEKLGDYELGYAAAPGFRLACAMAVSAAFPGLVGPLSVNSHSYTWYKRPSWDTPETGAIRVRLPYRNLHIYDGGVYDNLGLEPIFDAGKAEAKAPNTIVVASDAGSSLSRGFSLGPLNPFRLVRVLEVVMDQSRALRVRAFAKYLTQGNPGAYLQIGSVPSEKLNRYAPRLSTPAVPWLDEESVRRASTFPTSLWRLSSEEFDLLERHGYETAYWNHLAFQFLPLMPS